MVNIIKSLFAVAVVTVSVFSMNSIETQPASADGGLQQMCQIAMYSSPKRYTRDGGRLSYIYAACRQIGDGVSRDGITRYRLTKLGTDLQCYAGYPIATNCTRLNTSNNM